MKMLIVFYTSSALGLMENQAQREKIIGVLLITKPLWLLCMPLSSPVLVSAIPIQCLSALCVCACMRVRAQVCARVYVCGWIIFPYDYS